MSFYQLKKSVVILQASEENLSACSCALKNDFNLCACLTDGVRGIKAISNFKPDLLITSLVLEGLDGLGVISAAKEKSPNTKIIVLSEFCKNDVIANAVAAGADYYMIYPVDYNALIQRIHSIFTPIEQTNEPRMSIHRKKNSADERLSSIFLNIGIPASIKGYVYLREAIKLAIKEPEIINSITKKLYPAVAEIHKTTASKVERAIRHAIEVAWNKGRIEAFNSLFGVRAYSENEKPTNSEFIALIADRMLLDGYE